MAPKFSLQTVLDVRHSKVEALEIEMGKLQLAQQEKIALEETLQRLKYNLFDQLQDQMVGDMDLVLIEQLRGNIDQVEEGIQITRQVIEELGKRIEAKRRELVDLFGSHGTARLTGFAANRNELLGGALSSFRILHFATHARTGQDPRGLVLSRYDAGGRRIEDVFGFPELASLSLDADLVVTTACSSALGEEVAGEGLLGLSQGFLAAGIPRLLLTLWPVRGTSARELVSRFYPRLLAGASPAEALRQAQQQMWQEGWNLHDWGAFALYGDWRGLPEIFPATNQHQGLARVDDQWRKDVPSAATSRGAVR